MEIKLILILGVACNLASAGLTSRKSGCTIDLEKRLAIKKATPPIYYDLKSGKILYPVNSRTLEIEDGGEVGILCHSTDVEKSTIQGVSLPKGVKESSLVRVQCKGDDFKSLDTGKTVAVEKVSCTGKGFEPVVQVMGDSVFESCSTVGVDGRDDDLIGSMVLIQIGWAIPDFGFSPQIDLCVDNKMFGTVWTNHTVMPGIEQKDKRPTRPSFKSDLPGKHRFFKGVSSSTMADLYSKSNQVKVFKEELNGNKLSDGSEIIDVGKGSSDWFAKGHLSPDAAFIYDFEQEATYFFINVDPQFQAFNNGNWKAAEAQTRKLADKKKRAMRVMQGTSHTLQYRNSKGRKTDVDLYFEDKISLPCNKYFWKVVHDFEKNEAIAFVGINDPHWELMQKGDRDRLFKDVPSVCDQLSWVGWDVNEDTKGKMICASVEDVFKKGNMDNFPDLSDKKGKFPKLITTED